MKITINGNVVEADAEEISQILQVKPRVREVVGFGSIQPTKRRNMRSSLMHGHNLSIDKSIEANRVIVELIKKFGNRKAAQLIGCDPATMIRRINPALPIRKTRSSFYDAVMRAEQQL